MIAVRQESAVPPGGFFRAVHPETQVEFRHHTIDGVWTKYNTHCRSNGFKEPSRQEIVENICANTKANICEDSDSPTFGQMAVSLFHDVVEWAKAGFPTSRAAVEARLPICEVCPYYRGATGGSYFSVACGKCGCSGLKLAIHTTICPDSPPRWAQFNP